MDNTTTSNHPQVDIAKLFNAEDFRLTGHRLIDLLSNHLKSQLNHQPEHKRPVINWRDPAIENANWQKSLPIRPTLDTEGLLQQLESTILNNSLSVHHPRNMGHQVAPPLPIAALCDLVAALTNQAMAVYEAGPSATMLERQVLAWLCELIGWKTLGSHSHGFLTSGGAQANLTALLAARQVATRHIAASELSDSHSKVNVWKDGIGEIKFRILVSEYSHYSISRATGIMGLGTDAVIKITCDINGGMELTALIKAHQQCIENNEVIIAVVATAGCTPTGSVDPLKAIGTYCNAQQLWLHVDGAHGASALLSSQHKQKLAGIELADSVVWDGHKLLYMPAAVSAVLFKDAQNSYAAFAQEASYLFADGHEQEFTHEYNSSYRTLECTKRMMGLKLWAAFSLYGTDGLGSIIDNVFAKAQVFAEKISMQHEFELLMPPQTNIVCFRHIKVEFDAVELNQHQANVRQSVIRSGEFHITQVEHHGKLWLRTTIMNPLTTAEDFDALLALIKTI